MTGKSDILAKTRSGQLLGTYVIPGLISFGEGELVFSDGRHEIRNASFPEDLLRDEQRLTQLLQDLPDLMELFYTAEGDHRLRCARASVSGRLQPYFRNEDVTGISLLLLFPQDMLRLYLRDADHAELFAEISVFRGLPDAERMLSALAEDILTFHHGERAEIRVRPFQRSRTEDLSDGMTVTYLLDDEFESRFGTVGTQLVPDRGKRMENVLKNKKQTLDMLSEMLRSIGRH